MEKAVAGPCRHCLLTPSVFFVKTRFMPAAVAELSCVVVFSLHVMLQCCFLTHKVKHHCHSDSNLLGTSPIPTSAHCKSDRFAVSLLLFSSQSPWTSPCILFPFVCLGLGWFLLTVYWGVHRFPILAVVGRYSEDLPGATRLSDCLIGLSGVCWLNSSTVNLQPWIWQQDFLHVMTIHRIILGLIFLM